MADNSSGGAPLQPSVRRYKRSWRTLIIDRDLQLRYIVGVVLISAVLSAALGWFLWSQRNLATTTILESLEQVDWVDEPMKKEIASTLEGGDSNLLLLVGATCGILVLVLGGFMVVMTHRAAGPLYKISTYFDAITKGTIPATRPLRKHDEFKAFFDTFSRALETTRERARKDREVLASLVAALDQAAPADEAVRAANEALRARVAAKDLALRDSTEEMPAAHPYRTAGPGSA